MASRPSQHSQPPPYRDFDDFLIERGLYGSVKAAVDKRIVAYLLDERRKELGISKASLAKTVGTSRTQIDRILDARNQNITLETLNRVAQALGKRVRIELVD